MRQHISHNEDGSGRLVRVAEEARNHQSPVARSRDAFKGQVQADADADKVCYHRNPHRRY